MSAVSHMTQKSLTPKRENVRETF